MSIARTFVIAALAGMVGVTGGAIGTRWATPPVVVPVPPVTRVAPVATPASIDCGELEALHRPLYEMRTAPMPTTGFQRDAPTDIDVARDDDERVCMGRPTCILFPEGALQERQKPPLGIVLGASRLTPRRSASIRIAANADGIGIPPFANDASVSEGDVVPTLAGPAKIVAIRAHDPKTYVVAKLIEGPHDAGNPMRFFLGPSLTVVVADYMLSFTWAKGAAHVSARHIGIGRTVTVEPAVEGNVTNTITLGSYRYSIIAKHPPSGGSAGFIEVDARPDTI